MSYLGSPQSQLRTPDPLPVASGGSRPGSGLRGLYQSLPCCHVLDSALPETRLFCAILFQRLTYEVLSSGMHLICVTAEIPSFVTLSYFLYRRVTLFAEYLDVRSLDLYRLFIRPNRARLGGERVRPCPSAKWLRNHSSLAHRRDFFKRNAILSTIRLYIKVQGTHYRG